MFRPAKTGTGNWRGVRNNIAVTGGPWSKRFVGCKLTEEEKKMEARGADPQWLVNAPYEEGMTIPDIAGAVIAMHADSCFEELCDLYVALTRARYGMYVLLPQRGKAKIAAYSWDWAAWARRTSKPPKNRRMSAKSTGMNPTRNAGRSGRKNSASNRRTCRRF